MTPEWDDELRSTNPDQQNGDMNDSVENDVGGNDELAQAVTGPPFAESERVPRSRPRLLLIDDDELLLRAMTLWLKGTYDVATASGGAEGLALLEAETFDLIVSDLMMPGMDGRRVIEAAVQRRPELAERFVVMTAGAGSPSTQEFLDQTTLPVLRKPLEPEALLSALNSRLYEK